MSLPSDPVDRPRDGRPYRGEARTLVEFPQDELIAKWEEFFEEMGYLSKIISVADRYPEERSLAVAFDELNRFDTDMAIYLLRHPLNVLNAGEEAIRRIVPPGEEAALIHLRVRALPRDRRIPIRDLRAKHLGQYIAVEGLVRKSTEVRPRVTDALFQCLRCGTIIKEPQDGQNFREPLECYEEQGGCKRSASATKFKLLTETSLYLDTQKLEIQESPEGLRGGQEPQRLTLYVEDDLTGRITPGERIVMSGILRSVQKGRPGSKSTLFDIFMDVNSVEKEQVEFEEIEVTEEDARLIREAGSSPDILRMITASIAPSMYGMHVEKEALALQLFSGVPKVMPDGRRIRGDLHVLMVGDPGVGKSELLSYMSRLSPRGIYATGKAATAAGLCIASDSLILTDRGTQSIEDLARPYFRTTKLERPVETADATGGVVTFDNRHRSTMGVLEAVWRLKPPAAMLRITTASGRSVTVTPATKVLVDRAMGQSWIQARFLRAGMRVATSSRLTVSDGPARRPDSDLDLISGAGPHLREVRVLMAIPPAQAYGAHRRGGIALEHGEKAATRESLLTHINGLEAAYRRGAYDGIRIRLRSDLRRRIPDAIRAGGITGASMANTLGLAPGRMHDALYRRNRRPPRIPVRLLVRIAAVLATYDGKLAAEIEAEIAPFLRRIEKIPRRIEFLRLLASGDIRWEPVKEVSVRPSFPKETVFDLTVKDAHAFVANGILVHNTAAAVRDEFGEGRWTLEAGALVLADLGLACLHPQAEVLVNGMPRSVAELFDETRAVRAVAAGREIEVGPITASTVSFDPKGASASKAEIAAVIRRRYRGTIVRVTLSSGFELKVTPDHVVLDGETFEWKPLQDLRPNARLVAVQRLPPRRDPVHILDIVPDDWIVQPTSEEKRELRTKLLGKFATLSEANRTYGMSRDVVSGRSAVRVSIFRRLLDDLGLYETWKQRPFAFGRSRSTERLRVSTITPELAYLLGFVCGDGHVATSDRRSNISIFQSQVHSQYIRRVLDMSNTVSSRPWGMHVREMTSIIRGEPTRTTCVHMHRGSNLLAFLYNWLTQDDLANLLELDDASVRGFVAGLVDADGCVSLKNSRPRSGNYASVDLSIMFSPSVRANQRLLYALRRFDVFARIRKATGVLYVQITSRRDAERLLEAISPYCAKWKSIPGARRLMSAEHEEMPSKPTMEILRKARPRPWRLLEKGLWSTLHGLSNGNRRPFKRAVGRLTEAIRPYISNRDYLNLQALTGADYALDRIAEVRIEHHDGYVYDLRVPGSDDFLCDGTVVHNCIDEIEKMNPQDRSAIHEAMEQQRISVAKAGITAVLQSRCAVLAAANPKFGRFDEHKYISEQIDLPPALLSRFDIIFSMIDRPQADRDRELAEHILKGHRVGEIARRRETGAVTEETRDLEVPYTPHFSPEFLRKYVAYAKRIYPIMTDEAMAIIEKKYLEIRKTGEAAGSSVPITPRQLEAIIRLAEAGARMRLGEAVTADDADRAVRIVEYWMGKVAGEEGRFDIDIIQTGISQSQREQIISIRDIISELAGPEGVADYEDIVRIAQERGIPPAKVDSWLKRWAQEGEIYSPAKNKYKLVERL